jgi:hypothetical protein
LVDDDVDNPVDVTVEHDGAAEVKVHVTGAEPGTPFWLVLGQSYSPGWQADIGGGPELVDGFANGWRVSPTASEFDVTLTFTPQAQVDRALWLSLVAALVCVGLALRPARRRTIVPAGAVPTAWALNRALRFQGTRPGRRRAGLVVAGLTGLAWFVAGPAVGAVIGVGAAATARHPARRRWLLLASPVSLGLVALYVIGAQVLDGPKPGLDWPFHMRLVHPLGWCAALFLVADVVISAAWRDGRGSYLPTSGNQMPLADDVSVEGAHEADLVKTE